MGGIPARLSSPSGQGDQLTNPNSLRFSTWAMSARDSWQATRNLTINYGLRREYDPIYSHDHFGAVRFDPATRPQTRYCGAT